MVGDPLQLLLMLGAAPTRFPSGRFQPIFLHPWGFEPPDDASEHECVPTEPAGHGHVQPRPPLFREDIIVDPCRFDFFPNFLRYSKIVQLQPLSALLTPKLPDNTD